MGLFQKTTLIIFVITLHGCEKNYTISSHSNHYIKEKHFKILDKNEPLPKEVQNLISEESKETLPHIKFPLAYYLIQEEDIQLIFNQKIDPNISDQLYMVVSGIKYYKFFVHPDLDESYSFLQNAYRFISPDQTEFFAITLNTPKTLAIWNQRSNYPRPFIINSKISKAIEPLVNQARTPAYQLERPESVGMLLKKDSNDKTYPIQGQEITAIPSL